MRTAEQELRIREVRHDWGWKVELAPGDGEALSWCSVIDVPMRVGGAVVPTGGIGGVGTLEAHRRRGHSRRVMEAAVARMHRQRYGLSFLHGIQDYYHKFGYITCMAEHVISLPVADVLAARREPDGVRLRSMKKRDVPAVVRMYERENGGRTGSVRRGRGFAGFGKGTWWSYPAGVRVAVDGSERVVGYVVYDEVKQHCRAAEVGGTSAKVLDGLAVFLARRARRLGHETFEVYGPPDTAFGVYARRFGCRLRSHYPRNEKPMGRIIDLERCLQALRPALARRWPAAARQQSLALATDIGDAVVGWDGDELRVDGHGGRDAVALGQRELTQLLMGYARPADLSAWGRARVPRARRELLAALFPLQEAHMWWADRF